MAGIGWTETTCSLIARTVRAQKMMRWGARIGSISSFFNFRRSGGSIFWISRRITEWSISRKFVRINQFPNFIGLFFYVFFIGRRSWWCLVHGSQPAAAPVLLRLFLISWYFSEMADWSTIFLIFLILCF